MLDVLNYYMLHIFEALGYNVAGGKFVNAKRKEIDVTKQADIYLKVQQLGLPVDPDDVYETLGVKKPEDFEEQMAAKEEQTKALTELLEAPSKGDKTPPEEPSKGKKKEEEKGDKSLKDRLAHFFGLAPGAEIPLGADNDF